MGQYFTQLAVLILCYNSTGCDEVDNHFFTDADTMIDIVCEVNLSKD